MDLCLLNPATTHFMMTLQSPSGLRHVVKESEWVLIIKIEHAKSWQRLDTDNQDSPPPRSPRPQWPREWRWRHGRDQWRWCWPRGWAASLLTSPRDTWSRSCWLQTRPREADSWRRRLASPLLGQHLGLSPMPRDRSLPNWLPVKTSFPRQLEWHPIKCWKLGQKESQDEWVPTREFFRTEGKMCAY